MAKEARKGIISMVVPQDKEPVIEILGIPVAGRRGYPAPEVREMDVRIMKHSSIPFTLCFLTYLKLASSPLILAIRGQVLGIELLGLKVPVQFFIIAFLLCGVLLMFIAYEYKRLVAHKAVSNIAIRVFPTLAYLLSVTALWLVISIYIIFTEYSIYGYKEYFAELKDALFNWILRGWTRVHKGNVVIITLLGATSWFLAMVGYWWFWMSVSESLSSLIERVDLEYKVDSISLKEYLKDWLISRFREYGYSERRDFLLSQYQFRPFYQAKNWFVLNLRIDADTLSQALNEFGKVLEEKNLLAEIAIVKSREAPDPKGVLEVKLSIAVISRREWSLRHLLQWLKTRDFYIGQIGLTVSLIWSLIVSSIAPDIWTFLALFLR